MHKHGDTPKRLTLVHCAGLLFLKAVSKHRHKSAQVALANDIPQHQCANTHRHLHGKENDEGPRSAVGKPKRSVPKHIGEMQLMKRPL